jgi:DNA-binding response OmpR family regulator
MGACLATTNNDAKPFSYLELRVRVAALLRRADRTLTRSRLRAGPLKVDPSWREVRLHGERVVLSRLPAELEIAV